MRLADRWLDGSARSLAASKGEGAASGRAAFRALARRVEPVWEGAAVDPNVPSGGQPPGWVPPPDPSQVPEQGSWTLPPGTWPEPQVWHQPQPGPWAPQPKRKRFGWGAVIGAFLIGGVISAIVTFGGLIALAFAVGMPDAIAGTHPTPAEGAEMAEVGDCLTARPGSAVVVDRSQVVDCDEAHDSEVAAVIQVPGFNHRPSEDDLKAYTDDACSLAFQGYVGTDPDESQFGYAAIVPDSAAWADGDRTVWCMVDTVGQPAGEGSVRNSRR